MRKLTSAAALALLLANPALAGGINEKPIQPDVIVEDTVRTGASGGVLIPLLFVVLIAAALAGGGGGGGGGA